MSLKNDRDTSEIEPVNFLIVRTDRIGDVVLSLPLSSIIKKKYPRCKITFLLREYTKSLAENNPYTDEILILKEAKGKILLKENIEMLSGKKFDSCVIPNIPDSFNYFFIRNKE
jgi:ADP-heptose:LPS heptosyltransferase